MRALEPAGTTTDDELVARYHDVERPAPAGRPWVLCNMVASLDGATALDGVSGGLGGEGDRAVFGVVRAVPDVIVVAAGTARAENYGPPRVREDLRARRLARGQAEVPELAVVTRSLDLDPGSRLFADGHRPLVLTTDDAPVERATALAQVAELAPVGHGDVDLTAALALLAERGHQVALLEGGPALNGQFVAADLVDELCLSVSPLLAGGASRRLAVGPEPDRPRGLVLAHVLEHDDALFVRYRRP